jgi:biotin carboxylase
MPTKKLLILGGSHADIPLIQAAKQLGYYVITSGNRASDIGHVEADEYCPADFSDREAMLSLARQLEIDAICPCCNDFAAISCAYVAEKMGLPGHDSLATSELLHHKDSYRRFAMDNDIPTPRAQGYSDIESAVAGLDVLRFPLIIKPIDLSGGKGISKVADRREARESLQAAFSLSKSQRVVVEEFIEGSNHGFSAFLRDGKIVFHFSDDEHYYLNKYMVSGASTPSSVPRSAIDDLTQQSEKIAQLLELKAGIFHVQFILSDGKPVIIEICRRPPGDLYIQLVKLATGIDYPGWIVKAAAGMDCNELTHQDVTGLFTRHCIMGDSSGTLNEVIISPEIAGNIVDKMTWWQKGDVVQDYLTHKYGIVFVQYSSAQEMVDKLSKLNELVFPTFIEAP